MFQNMKLRSLSYIAITLLNSCCVVGRCVLTLWREGTEV